jgi:hypothetical protein
MLFGSQGRKQYQACPDNGSCNNDGIEFEPKNAAGQRKIVNQSTRMEGRKGVQWSIHARYEDKKQALFMNICRSR